MNNTNNNPVNDINVGDQIVMGDYKYEVIKVDDGLIWYKIPNGVGQTIRAHVKEVIKRREIFLLLIFFCYVFLLLQLKQIRI